MNLSFALRPRALLAPALALAAACGLAACGGSGGGTSGSSSSAGASGGASSPGTIPTNAGAAALQAQYQAVVKSVLPSVVQISTTTATGSGVVFDSKGDIVTNAHVVGTAKNVQVRSATSNTTVPARVIGAFRADDLAVVRVTRDASALKAATFANSQDASIGTIVLAMGNPLGLTDSVTQGIVSAIGRTVTEPAEAGGSPALIASAIQTTAAINPGNSGGALVNLAGQVLGIPTLTAREPTAGGVAPGIGFAIPSNTVKNIAGQLVASGKVTNSDRASLGVTVQTMANGQGEAAGVAVVSVAPGGAAAKAGIQAGDLIVGVNGRATPSVPALEGELAMLRPGETTTVQVVRNGKTQHVSVKLGTLSG